jgi:ATP-dependent DNA helicase RecG
MQKDPFVTAQLLSLKIGISLRKIETNIKKLKEIGYINRIGPAKGGHWEVIQK